MTPPDYQPLSDLQVQAITKIDPTGAWLAEQMRAAHKSGWDAAMQAMADRETRERNFKAMHSDEPKVIDWEKPIRTISDKQP